ncbi:hypothetical protein [Chroogloeocystis siderophila]|uniref:Uncharacterized protein n=1 Tax=Chroogloeocystis siderophila 5.2 s.c.1 TaxID=247279 RepID=A0A1U7HBJ3_9CHRO|nr:hypothetical protein [Chroogloeocystis siderophila]OKH20934.1 hypothetical protein NIES1031_22530 [Chroogloeocystis siderophila 5.2 s.c.1]
MPNPLFSHEEESCTNSQAEYAQLRKIAQTDAMKELALASFPQASTLLDIASHVLAGQISGSANDTATIYCSLEVCRRQAHCLTILNTKEN